MKICFVNLMPYPYTTGGVETHIDNLAYFLMKRGHEVYVISSKSRKKKKEYPRGLFLYNVGIPHRIFSGKITDYFYRFIFELIFIISVFFTILKIKPDIINSENLIIESLPCSLASLFGFRYVSTSHGIFFVGFKRLYELRKKKFMTNFMIKIYKIIEKFNLFFCKKIICLGKDTFSYYKKFNSLIIPNGINLEEFKYKEKKRKKTIIFVGRFTKQKQPLKLIFAMDKLKNYKLFVVGLGPLEKNVKKECNKRRNCKFLGAKTHEELPELLNKAEFFVLPSEFEGLPIALLEAMACGCIVVITKVGDISDVITDGYNGFLLKDNNPETIARKIREISKLSQKKLREISKNAVRTIKEKYDWNKIVEKFLEVYENARK